MKAGQGGKQSAPKADAEKKPRRPPRVAKAASKSGGEAGGESETGSQGRAAKAVAEKVQQGPAAEAGVEGRAGAKPAKGARRGGEAAAEGQRRSRGQAKAECAQGCNGGPRAGHEPGAPSQGLLKTEAKSPPRPIPKRRQTSKPVKTEPRSSPRWLPRLQPKTAAKAPPKPAKDDKPQAAGEKPEGGAETPDSPLLDLSDAAVKKLIKTAKKRGYVTYEEVNAVLPSDQVSPDQIEDIMSMFSEMGINVVDEDEVEEAEPETPEEESTELAERTGTAVASKSNAREGSDRTDDPVRMYLREMGSVELLSREGEIAIAKRIEAGRETMIEGLCESPLTFQAIIIWRDQLAAAEILLRDIIDLEATYAGPDAKQAAPVVPVEAVQAGAPRRRQVQDRSRQAGAAPRRRRRRRRLRSRGAAGRRRIRSRTTTTISRIRCR